MEDHPEEPEPRKRTHDELACRNEPPLPSTLRRDEFQRKLAEKKM